MLNILFNLNLLWIAGLLLVLSTAIAFFCIFLHQYSLYIPVAEWLSQHITCPVIKILILMLMALLLFPLMFQNTAYADLFQFFSHPSFLLGFLNIVLFSSVLFTFLPILNQPLFAMPLLACIATGLLFLHSIALPAQQDFNWLPSGTAFGIIMLLTVVSYLLNRWLSRVVSEWIDLRFLVTDSKNMVQDINYLIFQMPVVLAYGLGLSN